MKSSLAAALLVLLAAPLFASADLSITGPSTATVVLGETRFPVYSIRNAGPDAASQVMVTFTVTSARGPTPCSGGCLAKDNLASGDSFVFNTLFSFFPATTGDVTITATVSSSTADPNVADNSVTTKITFSPNPDVVISLSAPQRLDLGLPFPLSIRLVNLSTIVAHDLVATVDFGTDVGVQSLPAGCDNPVPGRVTCRFDSLGGNGASQVFNVTLIAPTTYGGGSFTLTATATEREQDFDPTSNSSTRAFALYNTFYVTSTANDGAGSLRQAILDANAATTFPVVIGFRITEPSATPWKTIRITSPLPVVNTLALRIDGAIQGKFFGVRNPDGPEIEISGGGIVDGNGLVISNCGNEVTDLTINGFQRNGLSVTGSTLPNCGWSELHNLFVGTDPTGAAARPNGQRGIGISVPNGTDFNHVGVGTTIHDCVISGNTRSGIFDLSGFATIWGNRIGVKAHSDEPLPNGASGIFMGPGGYGSTIGTYTDIELPTLPGNVIAFNREMGVAIGTGAHDISIRSNRIWGNGSLGIDIGLDGPTMSTTSEFGVTITTPVLTLAHYDPVSKKTIVEGDTPPVASVPYLGLLFDFYANDAVDSSGFGEGQRPAGSNSVKSQNIFTFVSPTHFRIELDGDLTGQFITATVTNSFFPLGFAKPEGVDFGLLTQTSEFSRPIEVR